MVGTATGTALGKRMGAGVAMLLAAAALTACGGSSSTMREPKGGQVLGLEAFGSGGAAVEAPRVAVRSAAPGAMKPEQTKTDAAKVDAAKFPERPLSGLVLASDDAAQGKLPNVTGPIAASEGVLNVNAVAGKPEEMQPGMKPAAVGQPVLVDAKIGDINGKPVYASKFLDSRANMLREKAVELSRTAGPNWRTQWRQKAVESIVTGLNSMIEDELLRAEAIANFTPEQQKGFFQWMEAVSDRLASEKRGSVSAVAKDLEGKNQTLQDYVKEREVQELVIFQLNKHVRSRVNVSWRDIKQMYEVNFNEFYNKPPRARFRLVQIPNRNAEGLNQFTSDLAEGKTSFEELASKPYNTNSAKTGGLEEKVLTADRATMTFYNHPDLNKAAQTLQPGETAGPFTLGDYTAWIHLDTIVDERRSLYDAQIGIESRLKAMKFEMERQKYIARLRSKATVTSVEEMTRRLLAIAEERYLPKEQ